MSVSEATYRRVALEDPSGHWELHCGHLRQKPDMSFAHNYLINELYAGLLQQLDARVFAVRANMGRVRRSSQSYYIPDVYVVPATIVHARRRDTDLEVYETPLPLVVEVWSPSTGDYDVEVKLKEYQERGDLEIWLVHPYERTVTTWIRHADGQYKSAFFSSGTLRPSAIPDVAIDLDALFQ